ncbi:MAG TPA: hypothetical protein VKN99_13865 [Polyangia bacterium]|nr:hypothetical protein [Polyangia bacterium]
MRGRAAAGFVLLVGLLLLGRVFLRAPVDVDVSFRLGRLAAGLHELDVRYQRAEDGALARHVVFRYPAGDAPSEQLHHTRLARGSYRVLLTLSAAAGSRTLERSLAVGGAGEHAYVDVE